MSVQSILVRLCAREPFGQRLGQCGDGELLLLAEDRTHGTRVPMMTKELQG